MRELRAKGPEAVGRQPACPRGLLLVLMCLLTSLRILGCQGLEDALSLSSQALQDNLARLLAQLLRLCPTLCSPLDCEGSSVHGILQAGILEWVSMPSSMGSFQIRDCICIGRQILYHSATREARGAGRTSRFLTSPKHHLVCPPPTPTDPHTDTHCS